MTVLCHAVVYTLALFSSDLHGSRCAIGVEHVPSSQAAAQPVFCMCKVIRVFLFAHLILVGVPALQWDLLLSLHCSTEMDSFSSVCPTGCLSCSRLVRLCCKSGPVASSSTAITSPLPVLVPSLVQVTCLQRSYTATFFFCSKLTCSLPLLGTLCH